MDRIFRFNKVNGVPRRFAPKLKAIREEARDGSYTLVRGWGAFTQSGWRWMCGRLWGLQCQPSSGVPVFAHRRGSFAWAPGLLDIGARQMQICDIQARPTQIFVCRPGHPLIAKEEVRRSLGTPQTVTPRFLLDRQASSVAQFWGSSIYIPLWLYTAPGLPQALPSLLTMGGPKARCAMPSAVCGRCWTSACGRTWTTAGGRSAKRSFRASLGRALSPRSRRSQIPRWRWRSSWTAPALVAVAARRPTCCHRCCQASSHARSEGEVCLPRQWRSRAWLADACIKGEVFVPRQVAEQTWLSDTPHFARPGGLAQWDLRLGRSGGDQVLGLSSYDCGTVSSARRV
jgi:hypothetical protein